MPDPPPRPTPLRLAICDDAPEFATLVRLWLDEMPDVELVHACATAGDLLDALPEVRPDVVLLDFMRPDGMEPGAIVDGVRALAPEARVVLMSSMPVFALAGEARDSGADGVCARVTSAEGLRAALGAGAPSA